MGSRPTAAKRAAAGLAQGLLTSSAAWSSYVTSTWFGFHEGYWAAISAIVVIQSEMEKTRLSGRDRFIGTAMGGLVAWGCATYWHGFTWVYALAVAVSVFICWVANVGNAGRLAAVAVSVIVLIPRDDAIWRVALFRFVEVSWGIAVALLVASLGARFGLMRTIAAASAD